MILPKIVHHSLAPMALVGCLLVSSPCWAVNRLQFTKPIVLPELPGEELFAVPLDSDVYQITRTGFPDIRIRTAMGDEVGFLIRRATIKKSRTVKEVWAAEDLALQPQENDGLEITFRVDIKKHPDQPQGIRLISPLKRFEHRVRIETSVDRKNWQPLAEELIFDYSQFMNVRNTSVELPTPSAEGQAFYRITIDQVTQKQQSQLLELSRHMQGEEETGRTERETINRQPFRIDRIELWRDTLRKDVVRDQQIEFPVEIRQAAQDEAQEASQAKQTVLYLMSRREPLTTLSLVTPTRNFSRRGRVEIRQESSSGPAWRSIGSGTLSRIEFRSLKKESLRLSFSEQRETEYRIVIENGDSRPLVVSGVLAQGNRYEVVFLAKPATEYHLAYGSPRLASPNFDVAALVASLGAGYTPLGASLGKAVALEVAPEEGEPRWKRWLSSGPSITVVIVLLVLVLGTGLYQASRRLSELDEK